MPAAVILCPPGVATERAVASILDLPHGSYRVLRTPRDVIRFCRGTEAPIYEFDGASKHPHYHAIKRELDHLERRTIPVDVHGVKQ